LKEKNKKQKILFSGQVEKKFLSVLLIERKKQKTKIVFFRSGDKKNLVSIT
jgi:hypothetical protein